MNCNTTHYRANSSSVPGDPTEESSRLGPAREATAFVEALRASGLEIPELRFEGEPTVSLQATTYRRRLARSLVDLGRPRVQPAALDSARGKVTDLLRRWIDHELGEVVAERDAELRALELDLDVMLGETLAASADQGAKATKE